MLKAYRGEKTTSYGLYTQAEPFFRKATYPTEGMRSVLDAALGRLAGDNSRPAIQRLETDCRHVLGRRLFERIDAQAADEAASRG